jgi:hypothetical protein
VELNEEPVPAEPVVAVPVVAVVLPQGVTPVSPPAEVELPPGCVLGRFVIEILAVCMSSTFELVMFRSGWVAT